MCSKLFSESDIPRLLKTHVDVKHHVFEACNKNFSMKGNLTDDLPDFDGFFYIKKEKY